MNIKDNEWIKANRIHLPTKKSLKPQVDTEVSKIVGREVFAQDPKLLALVIKFKRKYHKKPDDFTPDNNLTNPEFIKELKELYAN